METPKAHGTKMLAADKELSGKILDWVEDPSAPAVPETVEEPAEPVKAEGSGELPSDDEIDKALDRRPKGEDVSE
jgi:hypothetical protein